MRIDDMQEGPMFHFLLDASNRYPGEDWVERYADYAERRYAGIDRLDFIRRLNDAKKAHSAYVESWGYFSLLLKSSYFHDWKRWYTKHILANPPKHQQT